MTQGPDLHLTADELDAWLAGILGESRQVHLEHCDECLERAQSEREIIAQLAALPMLAPTPGFADRVMGSVAVPEPFSIRSLASIRRRFFTTRRSVAFAAGIGLFLLGSMAGSIVWTLSHPDTLATLGTWLLSEASQAGWLGLRAVASNFIEQPWYAGAKALIAHPGRLSIALGLASLAYLAGVFALRRLLALPTQQVAHANT